MKNSVFKRVREREREREIESKSQTEIFKKEKDNRIEGNKTK